MKNNGARRRPSTGAKVFLALVTCVNLILSLALALALLRRQEVLHALEGEEGIQVLALGPQDKGSP